METIRENPNTQKTSETKFNKRNIARELFLIFEESKTILDERKVEATFIDFTAYLAKKLPTGFVNDFVEEMTPTEWHLQNMMENPEYKKEFLKLAKKLKKK